MRLRIIKALTFVIANLLISGYVEAKQTAKMRYSPSRSSIANLGPGCRIKMDLPINTVITQNYVADPDRSIGGGTMTLGVKLPRLNYEQEVLSISCHFPESEAVTSGIVVRDIASGQWRLSDDMNMYYGLTAEMPSLYSVETVNSRGWAVRSAANGEFPILVLDFCLFHDERAICGSFNVGWQERTFRRLSSGFAKTIYHTVVDHSPYALQLIKSIQFIDDAPLGSENGSTRQ
jgi:hypothetical protein